VLDTCGDSDCSGCCSKNSSATGYLVDIERHTCERELGSAAACSGTIEWQPVEGASAKSSARRARGRSPRSRPRSRSRSRRASASRPTSRSRRSRVRSRSRSRPGR
jgi:hypothetical protein